MARRVVAAILGALVAVAVLAAPVAAGEHSVYGYGDAPFHGSTGFVALNHPLAAMAAPTGGGGYWLVSREGRVFSFGNVAGHGSVPVVDLRRPIVGMAARADGAGYWIAASDGSVFTFGAAGFHGSMGGVRLTQPVVGMAATPSGRGYWLVAQDGGIFSFGDAGFHGSTGAIRLNQPIVGMASTPSGRGYWLVARDGGIFSFGDARFYGSTGAIRLNRSIVGMAATATGRGYHLVGADGGVFTFGDAVFRGSIQSTEPVVGIVRNGTAGYWIATSGHVAASSTARPAEVRFGDGTHTVGAGGIPAGTYRQQSPSSACRWENTSTGAAGTGGGRWVVTVLAGETFAATGCGAWTSDVFPVTRGWEQPFGDGTWVVSTDVRAGTWRAPGGASCQWIRMRGFRLVDTEVIVEGGGAGQQTVLVDRGDVGFFSAGCGTWTRVG